MKNKEKHPREEEAQKLKNNFGEEQTTLFSVASMCTLVGIGIIVCVLVYMQNYNIPIRDIFSSGYLTYAIYVSILIPFLGFLIHNSANQQTNHEEVQQITKQETIVVKLIPINNANRVHDEINDEMSHETYASIKNNEQTQQNLKANSN